MGKLYSKIISVMTMLALLAGLLAPLSQPARAATVWNLGDVFAGINGGQYQVYTNAGVLKETISDGLGGFTTGCAFNGAQDKLYTTNFGNTKVVVYNDASPHTIAQTIDTGAVNPGGDSESVVFAASGDFYVGHPDGDDDIQRYNAAGAYQQSYNVAIENRGSDWLDLANDQKTMFYTSEGRKVKRYKVSGAGAQLADFAALPGTGIAFALRLLPPGDGSGGLLVADYVNVKKLDGTGSVVATYDVTGEDTWFSLSLDPDGLHFWAGNDGTGKFYKFAIGSPGVDTHVTVVDTGVGSGDLFGLCLKGEPTAALKDRRMTGGGTVVGNVPPNLPAGLPTEVKHGFELHCNIAQSPNRLEVNWGKGNKFHLEGLTSATCSNDPNIVPNPPAAVFDTYKGKGTGRYNGVSGATAEWTFTDQGEPGKNDTAELVIKDVTNVTVVSIVGTLKVGNHQAHK